MPPCCFVRNIPALSADSCHCSPLVKEIAKMREAWKHVNLPIVRALDKAMYDAGFRAVCAGVCGFRGNSGTSHPQIISRVAHEEQRRQAFKGERSTVAKLGERSFGHFSTSSSMTCIGPNKERRRVRSLSAFASTILRSSPALHLKLDARQLRKIHKLYFPEYKRAR